MPLSSWRPLVVWLLKAILVTWLLNVLFLAILYLSGYRLEGLINSDYLSKITLLEAGIAFVAGGAIAFSASVLPSKARENILKTGEPWTMEKLKKSEKTANKFITLAVIMLLVSLLVSILGF